MKTKKCGSLGLAIVCTPAVVKKGEVKFGDKPVQKHEKGGLLTAAWRKPWEWPFPIGDKHPGAKSKSGRMVIYWAPSQQTSLRALNETTLSKEAYGEAHLSTSTRSDKNIINNNKNNNKNNKNLKNEAQAPHFKSLV